MKAALKKLEEEEKRASMLLKMDERKRPYNSMTETKVGSLTLFSKYLVLRFLRGSCLPVVNDYCVFVISNLFRKA